MRERVHKPKFQPVITRVKLNPEQAVLQCSCYDTTVGFADVGMGNGYSITPSTSPYCGPIDEAGGKFHYDFASPLGGGNWAKQASTASS